MKFSYNPLLNDLSLGQQAAAKAVEKLSEKIRNQDHFSATDIAQILSEIKKTHALYKEAFQEAAFSWQVDHYAIQIALENEYRFIFEHDQTMTWTQKRWTFALVQELAIHHYGETVGTELTMPEHGFRLLTMWLFFQYFNSSVFSGAQCGEALDMAVNIVMHSDEVIHEGIQSIKQWRKDHDEDIRNMNSQKSRWRQEQARIERLLNGHMKQKEVKLYHIFYWCHPSWSFDTNVTAASKRLGVSEKCIRQILREHGIHKEYLWGYLKIYKEEAEAEYKKEVEWAEKVRSNTLTKNEKREFWRRFTIPNPKLMFRTFSTPEPDLIPAANPLLTDESCRPAKIQEVVTFQSQINIMCNPLQMSGMTTYSNANDIFRI